MTNDHTDKNTDISMKQHHQLLRRQIKRHLAGVQIDPEWQKFFQSVSTAYEQFDDDRLTIERTLELSSQELDKAHSAMRAVYERLIKSSVDGIFAFDHSCNLTVWNPTMERIFGLSRLQTIGKNALIIFPFLHESGYEDHIYNTLVGQVTTTVENTLIRADTNKTAYFECLFAPLFAESQDIIGGLGVIRDISRRKIAENTSNQQQKYLTALQETALHLNNRMELTELLNDMLSHIQSILNTPNAFIALYDNSASALRVQLYAGIFHHLAQQAFRSGEGIPGKVWRNRQPFIEVLDDVPDTHALAQYRWSVVPLFEGIRIIGVIGIAHHEQEPRFTNSEIALLKQFAQLATIALEHDALNEANSRLAAMANIDPLTGLPNHRLIMDRIDEEISRSKRTANNCTLLFLDIDHFKRINDTWGHRAGDAILREVAAKIQQSIRIEDFVGRYGGEEFAVVLTNASLKDALTTAARIRDTLNSQQCLWQSPGDESTTVAISVTVSIGIALFPQHSETRDGLIEAADKAMYTAKRTGRNRVCIADDNSYSTEETNMLGHNKVDLPVLKALITLVSAHDKDTNDHSKRIAHLVESVARSMGKDETEVEQIRLAAILHDIGKIGIPDGILHKPGPLSAQEWEIMRQHPEIGQQILVQLGGLFEIISTIVMTHHERWDGSGYPFGTSLESIPLGARIIAVVDSFDAMTSDRPYRKSISAKDACIELEQCSGRLYDPQIVAAFLKILQEQEQLHNDQAA